MADLSTSAAIGTPRSVPTAPSPLRRVRNAALQVTVAAGMAVRSTRGDPMARLAMPSGRRNPYPIYRQIQAAGPLQPSMIGWVTASYPVAARVMRDHQNYGNADVPDAPRSLDWLSRLISQVQSAEPVSVAQGRRITSPSLYRLVPDPLGSESMLSSDPPDHTRIRRLVSRAFTPRAVQKVRERVEGVADELLDRAPAEGFDVMSGYAGVLPVVVISELLGIPAEDSDRIKRWGDVLASGLDVLGGVPDHEMHSALVSFAEYLAELFEHRRREPGDLVIDALIAGSETEAGLTDRELTATAMLLLAAGFETTVSLIGNAMLALLQHPEQRELLLADPDLVGNLVEEVLRYDSPVQLNSRMVRADTELCGQQLRRGDYVLIALGGANRDPEIFADPDRFDITRANAREHLSFSVGIHHCLGAALARLEAEVALRTLFERYPRLSQGGQIRRGKGLILRGPSELPLRLGRG